MISSWWVVGLLIHVSCFFFALGRSKNWSTSPVRSKSTWQHGGFWKWGDPWIPGHHHHGRSRLTCTWGHGQCLPHHLRPQNSLRRAGHSPAKSARIFWVLSTCVHFLFISVMFFHHVSAYLMQKAYECMIWLHDWDLLVILLGLGIVRLGVWYWPQEHNKRRTLQPIAFSPFEVTVSTRTRTRPVSCKRCWPAPSLSRLRSTAPSYLPNRKK